MINNNSPTGKTCAYQRQARIFNFVLTLRPLILPEMSDVPIKRKTSDRTTEAEQPGTDQTSSVFLCLRGLHQSTLGSSIYCMCAIAADDK